MTINLSFIDSGLQLEEIPHWVNFFLQLGRDFITSADGKRRIILLSTPTESAGSALISLGAMLQRLSVSDSNDLSAHFESLTRSVLLDPDERPKLREIGRSGVYRLDNIDGAGMLWVTKENCNKGTRQVVTRHNAFKWYVDGQPKLRVEAGRRIPYEEIYCALVGEQTSFVSENFNVSDSYVCLAGPNTGKTFFQSRLSNIIFSIGDELEFTLSELLTVRGWSELHAQRVSYFNALTNDYQGAFGSTPSLIIADGPAAFSKVLGNEKFKAADVVGVTSRLIDRRKSEDLIECFSGIRRWYHPFDFDFKIEPPEGLSCLFLHKKK